MRRAYTIVGANPNLRDREFPVVTVESPLEVHGELDPATSQAIAGIKRWHDTQLDGMIR